MGELINIFGQVSDSQIPSQIARDTETAAAILAHEGAVDPHAGRYRRTGVTQFFEGGDSSSAPYASCWSSRSMATGYYGNSASAGKFSFGLHIQSYPWSDAAYIAFHRPGSLIAFLGLDTDNQLKWGGGDVVTVPKRIWHEAYGTPVWQAPSDSRLKKRVKPIDFGLEFLRDAKPSGGDKRPRSLTGNAFGAFDQPQIFRLIDKII